MKKAAKIAKAIKETTYTFRTAPEMLPTMRRAAIGEGRGVAEWLRETIRASESYKRASDDAMAK